MSERLRIRSGDVELAAEVAGDPAAAPVLLVHGYPDTRAVWHDVAAALVTDHRVASYDVRGAGESSAPREISAYRFERLVEDMGAVIDRLFPSRAVHLVGHDWGSIQSWEAVTSERLRGRFASFTSISGPPLDHAGRWLREQLGSGSWGGVGAAANQLLHSWYVGFFHLPVLAPLAWRNGLARLWPAYLRTIEGIAAPDYPGTIADDAARGVALYRANFRERILAPQDRRTEIRVALIVALRDRYVSPALLEGLERVAPRLERCEIDAGHWLPLSHPGELAAAISDLVRRVEAGATFTGREEAS